VEEMKKSYESQIKALTKELESEKKKVKALEAQLADAQKKLKGIREKLFLFTIQNPRRGENNRKNTLYTIGCCPLVE
jgi:predicted  nucleic acid-binding Zn-ribbon protein